MSYITINPATEEKIKEHAFDSAQDVERAVVLSVKAHSQWRKTPLTERLRAVEALEQALRAERASLARLMTTEMGKLERDSLSEIDKSISSCASLRELYPRWKQDLEYQLPSGFKVVREPLGVLLGIMPWNFPLWQVLRFAVPAILSGNSVLLKHAPCTWGSSELIAKIFAAAFPEGLLINLKVDLPMVAQLIADPRVRGVSLTGSRAAGMSVGGVAGAHLKKCVLELGGSDPYIILDDADLEMAVTTCVTSRLINAGQSCVSAKRFIVVRKNAQEFTERFCTQMAGKKIGDPLLSSTDLGPLARQDLRAQLAAQVSRSVHQGSTLMLGGQVPASGKGYYYPPTVLANVKPGQVAFDEELFGPVAAICTVENETQALEWANRSPFGLGAAIFTRDIERGLKLAQHEVEAGMVFINDFVRSDVTVPFGGLKDSGLGRELGREGAFEFTEIKTLFAKI